MSKEHRDTILNIVKVNNIPYQHDVHEPVRTSQEASDLRGVSMSSGAKAIVLRGKKTKQSILVVIPADRKVNAKKIQDLVGEKVSFNPRVEEEFDCELGSVPPFGSVIGLQTYADSELEDVLNFNIGLRTDSLQISKNDYLALENPIVGDFSM
ncbi:hypothetical protein KC901_00280 [Patescibacteria group bacterium]|nr:hypothetical protein [Patescibacteria group bacterium]